MALCMHCMNNYDDCRVCPYCGFNNNATQRAPYLPYKTLLNSNYIVGEVIQRNAESICYIGYDKSNSTTVRIREFYPSNFCGRKPNATYVNVENQNLTIYDKLFNDFVMYYRILAGLKGHSANVEILDIFPENNTCYVIEEDEVLLTFSEYINQNGGRLDWVNLRSLVMPVMSLIGAMHSNGIGHYNISPNNVRVTMSGKLKLTNCATENIRKKHSVLKSDITNGIAAPEQYSENASLNEQTDVYCFSAFLFYALSGKLPTDAPTRSEDHKLFLNTDIAKSLPPHIISALANGLSLDLSERTKSFYELKELLSAGTAVEEVREKISRTTMMKKLEEEKKNKREKSAIPAFFISFLATIVVVVCVVFVLLYTNVIGNNENNNTPTVPLQDATESTTVTEKVSNFVGLSYDEAESLLENTNIKIYRSYETVYSDVYEEGIIVSQKPEAGTPITSSDGSVIIYVEISAGPQTRVLPDITKYTVDDASELLGKEKFVVNSVREYSQTVPLDSIIGYKDLKAGDRVETGSEITIIISKGVDPKSRYNNNYNGINNNHSSN